MEKAHGFWAAALWLYQDPDDEDEKRLDDLNVAKVAFDRSLSRVEILGPDNVYELAEQLGEAIEELAELVTRRGLDNSTPLPDTAQGRRLNEADVRYAAAAKAVLGTDD